ncbi:mCG1029392, partial [Mus musculus]
MLSVPHLYALGQAFGASFACLRPGFSASFACLGPGSDSAKKLYCTCAHWLFTQTYK